MKEQLNLTDPSQFYQQYRNIILKYFKQDCDSDIAEFANHAFAAKLSAAKVIEIHLELMDDLNRQLKLEGRDSEVLLDYRITLIDVVSRLCEHYRAACKI